MHLAVKKNNLEVIQLLLKNEEININIKDKQGKKPIDYTKNNKIKKLLKGGNPFWQFLKNLFNFE